MKNLIPALIVLMSGFCLFNACNDPTVIGSDLLGDDNLNLAYTDTITIISKTIKDVDSVLTYSTSGFDPASFRLSTQLIGNLEEPIFGAAESELYADLRLNFSVIPQFARGEFKDLVSLDSMILVLPWDTLGIYGDTLQDYTLEIFEIDENIDPEIEHYSDETFDDKMLIAKLENFQPQPRKEVSFILPQGEISFRHFDVQSTPNSNRSNSMLKHFLTQIL